MQARSEGQGRLIKSWKIQASDMHQILTHIRCHMDDARIAVETGVDGV